MKEDKVRETIQINYFHINLKENETHKFIDELEELCEKYAIDGNGYFFNFKGE